MCEPRGPLQGLRILDLSRVLSGPFATMWLAAMGADVIKIENPHSGDVTREYGPFLNGNSAYFPTINHNKKAITLNLKAEEGKALFLRLVKTADVVIENFRPGVMDRLGLGYEQLSQVNPGIIYASISGYGTYGPYKDRPGYDVTAQGMSGIMFLTGQADAPPTRVGSSIGDTVAGMNIISAILAALYCRQQTGLGQMVETSLVDSLISLSTQDYIRYFAAGMCPEEWATSISCGRPTAPTKQRTGITIWAAERNSISGLLPRPSAGRSWQTTPATTVMPIGWKTAKHWMRSSMPGRQTEPLRRSVRPWLRTRSRYRRSIPLEK